MVRDDNGAVLFHDRGVLKTPFVVDTRDDNDLDNDIFVDGGFELLADQGSHPALYVDFCGSSRTTPGDVTEPHVDNSRCTKHRITNHPEHGPAPMAPTSRVIAASTSVSSPRSDHPVTATTPTRWLPCAEPSNRYRVQPGAPMWRRW